MSRTHRRRFDDDLQADQRLILEMGGLAGAWSAARSRRCSIPTSAGAARVSDDAIMDALPARARRPRDLLIAMRQPMADDLRGVVAAIRMAGDLERIGDLAKNIAKRVSTVGQRTVPRDLSHSIDAMAQLVLEQVPGVVEDYTASDADSLRSSVTTTIASTSNTRPSSANC